MTQKKEPGLENHDITILVVDDDADIRFATSRIIQSAGYGVVAASSGLEALETARQVRPDMVLLDVVLPDIMGTEVCRRIKADPFFDGTFVLLTSGLKTGSSHQTEGLDVGADGYIVRPVSNRELTVRVNAMVRIMTAERKRAYAILKASHEDLVMRHQILHHFLVYPDFGALGTVLELLQESFKAPYGLFVYQNEKEELKVVPHLPGDQPGNQTDDKTSPFSLDYMISLGKESREKKQSFRFNRIKVSADTGKDLHNVLFVPVVVSESLIGQIILIDKPGGFTHGDQDRLESLCAFMAPALQIYMEKETAQKQLKMHIKDLKQKNIALHVLLEKREQDKIQISHTIMDSLDKLVLPYIEKLKNGVSRQDAATIAGILETNLKQGLFPFEKSVSAVYRNFTPTEIQVADFIKSGKTSKEIAAILNISPRSINFHRNNIRKKLQITHARTNLRTLLLSLS